MIVLKRQGLSLFTDKIGRSLIYYYSTRSGSVLSNTKKQGSTSRKIKVNHVSKESLKDLLDYNKVPVQKTKSTVFERLELQRDLLSNDLNMSESQIDEILGNNEQMEKEFQEEQKEFKKNNNIFFSEKFTAMKEDDDDDNYIKEDDDSSNKYSGDLDQDSYWKKLENIDELKDYRHENEHVDKQYEMELEKKGMKMVDGRLHSGGIPVPSQYKHFFLDPDAPTSRKEKNLYKRMDALKKEIKDRREQKKTQMLLDSKYSKFGKPNRKIIIDEHENVHTVVQKRMSDKILDVLRESAIFTPSCQLDILEGDGKEFGHFSNPLRKEIMDIDDADPVVSAGNIEFTKATMSSDLRWVKVYWKRINDDESDNHFQKKNSLSQEELHDKMGNISVATEDFNQDLQFINNLSNVSTKHVYYDIHKDLFKDKDHSIKSTSSNQKYNITVNKTPPTSIQNDQDNNNINSYFGENSKIITSEQIQLDFNLPKNSIDIQKFKNSLKPVVEEADYDHSAKKTSKSTYYRITDKDITYRLNNKLKGRIRGLIAKRVKTRYVPDLFFLKDEKMVKDEINHDLLENLITPELKQMVKERHQQEMAKEQKYVSKFSSLFSKSPTSNAPLSVDFESIDDEIENDRNLIDLVNDFAEVQDEETLKYISKISKKLESLEAKVDQNTSIHQTSEPESPSSVDKSNIFKQFNKDL
ncbi:hypothetical protein DLAC_01740 [Tieghemostelium lacteum]|uniref:Uncharacterized protein n=1 Tax=Tieghemostelium lacteum TaxID=361077 RepID=A0A152A663_TIELA|nr:hypothetical protein DLAC_01740 [Tieghemostelium lacteum]|eukprot:KYR01729.1 hypothetical protein DLAC_01740 [Tieghemostelium lacteum]